MENLAKKTKSAFLKTMNFDNDKKNSALQNIINNLKKYKNEILNANKADLEYAQTLDINKSTFNRLKLDENKIEGLIKGLKDLIKLPDPVNTILWQKELDEGLILKKVSTPIGVIGVIFEARPDCYIQIASLLIKSGNCGILKGGSEAKNTNTIMARIVSEALNNADFPENTINIVYDRNDVKKMLSFDNYINLIIPRGSNKLVQYIKENTKIPVLGHASGICHIFVDETAELYETAKIIIDAKTQYPSACNSVETVLIHKNFDCDSLKKSLIEAKIKIIENPKDYSIEYGDTILNLKIVENVDEAIEHINKYGSGHTDSILSKNNDNIEKFMNFVDSSSVYSNCSTRFADGYRYGFGAEVGISTNKTHARGPVGLEGLTIYKYKLYGSNDIVAPYANGEKKFSHKML